MSNLLPLNSRSPKMLISHFQIIKKGDVSIFRNSLLIFYGKNTDLSSPKINQLVLERNNSWAEPIDIFLLCALKVAKILNIFSICSFSQKRNHNSSLEQL